MQGRLSHCPQSLLCVGYAYPSVELTLCHKPMSFCNPDIAAGSRMLQQTTASKQLPLWRGNVKNLDAQAAILWGQVMRAVQVSGYNLVAPPGARGATADWVREGTRMQRWHFKHAAACCPNSAMWANGVRTTTLS